MAVSWRLIRIAASGSGAPIAFPPWSFRPANRAPGRLPACGTRPSTTDRAPAPRRSARRPGHGRGDGGSSPGALGAKMLVTLDGKAVGTVGGLHRRPGLRGGPRLPPSMRTHRRPDREGRPRARADLRRAGRRVPRADRDHAPRHLRQRPHRPRAGPPGPAARLPGHRPRRPAAVPEPRALPRLRPAPGPLRGDAGLVAGAARCLAATAATATTRSAWSGRSRRRPAHNVGLVGSRAKIRKILLRAREKGF